MIFFIDKEHPTFKARTKLKEIVANIPVDASDRERIEITTYFLAEHFKEYGKHPAPAVVERLGNFVLKPYINKKDEEYKILSIYTMERHRSREQVYRDSYDDYYS